MHHIQPEILLRTWVFDEDFDATEQRYADPIPLSEQLLLRAGYRLQKTPYDETPTGVLR